MKAERETADRLIAHFLADRIGATFTGRISGVTRAGLFVKLEDTGADGFVPARTLGAEYYQYDESRQAMIGTRSGAMHRLGDVVEVRLVEAAPVAGALRFELLSNDSGREPAARKFPLKARGRPRDQRDQAERPERAEAGRKDRRKAQAERRAEQKRKSKGNKGRTRR
jgi:ribonuclease R